MAQSDDEDDYMNMTFEDTAVPGYETALQRAARKRKEGERRATQKTKAEREADAEAAREAALATALPETNKGFKMMAKFGFKQGDALGKSADARKVPIQVEMKGDRGGIGMESERKRKIREQFEEFDRIAKRSKEEEGDYLEDFRQQQKEKKAERDLSDAQRTAERLEAKANGDSDDLDEDSKPLSEINILWRSRAKRRADFKREKKRNRDLKDNLGSRLPTVAHDEADDDDENTEIALGRAPKAFYTTVDDDDEIEDPELTEFEALPVSERLHKVLVFLRDTYQYCLYCGYQYPDAAMEGCPGVIDEDHD